MSKFCLLIFSYNSNNDVLRLVKRFEGKMDEIVIIDSSREREYNDLCKELEGRAIIHRVFPLGVTGIYRNYANAKIKSDYVLNLDCDEDASDTFLQNFRSLDTASAYVLGWFHVKLSEQAKKLVLYKNNYVKWMGHVFENPVVNGKTEDVSGRFQILHYADFEGGYGKQTNRYERYFFYESVCRPPTYYHLLNNLFPGQFVRKFSHSQAVHSVAPQKVWRMAVESAYVERLIREPEQRKVARFLLDYGISRLSYFYSLSKQRKDLFIQVSRDVYSSGGMSQYLNIDDERYVDALTQTFDWSISGIEVARRLIMYRHLDGKPLKSFDEFPYSKQDVDNFWKGDIISINHS